MYAISYDPEYFGIYYWRHDRSESIACYFGHFLFWCIWYYRSEQSWIDMGRDGILLKLW